jgi:hypothetical protein
MQEWPKTQKVIDNCTNDKGRAMNLDHISATTYVIWRQERLWEVDVLQRVRISSLVRVLHVSACVNNTLVPVHVCLTVCLSCSS